MDSLNSSFEGVVTVNPAAAGNEQVLDNILNVGIEDSSGRIEVVDTENSAAAGNEQVPENFLDVGIEVSSGLRSTRETTRGSNTVGSSGSTTRPTNSSASDVPSPSTSDSAPNLTVRADHFDSAKVRVDIENSLAVRETTGAPQGIMDPPRSYISLAEEDAVAFLDRVFEFCKERTEDDEHAEALFKSFLSSLNSFEQGGAGYTFRSTYNSLEAFFEGSNIQQDFRNLIFNGSLSLNRLNNADPESPLDAAIVQSGLRVKTAVGFPGLCVTREKFKCVLSDDDMIIMDEFFCSIIRFSELVSFAVKY